MTAKFLSINTGTRQRFEILGEIVRARSGVVYRVLDHDLGRHVACKIPAGDAPTDAETARRFGEEVRIIAQLNHPGVPQVFDIGVLHDGRPFMIMKLIKGRMLDAILNEQIQITPEIGRHMAVFQEVCRTVAYAHCRGVVHRNLEPANVAIGAFGDVQVLGWGLALVIPKEGPEAVPAEDVRFGADHGNRAYMAPEQARGEATDFRADVFALGALLCHILTGAPPFLGEDVARVAQMAANARLEDALSRLDNCIGNKELVALAVQCLEPRREDRLSDAGEVARRVAMTPRP